MEEPTPHHGTRRRKSVRAARPKLPADLVSRDSRCCCSGNIWRKKDKSQDEFTVGDWQLCFKCPCVWDFITLFLCVDAKIDTPALIKDYHDELCKVRPDVVVARLYPEDWGATRRARLRARLAKPQFVVFGGNYGYNDPAAAADAERAYVARCMRLPCYGQILPVDRRSSIVDRSPNTPLQHWYALHVTTK